MYNSEVRLTTRVYGIHNYKMKHEYCPDVYGYVESYKYILYQRTRRIVTAAIYYSRKYGSTYFVDPELNHALVYNIICNYCI